MKRYFPVAAAAVLLALLAPLASAGPAAAQDGTECLAEKWLPRQSRCLGDAAKATGSAAPCLLSKQPALRWQCVASFAESSGDAAACKLLPPVDVAKGELSRDLCQTHLAIAWKKVALCEGLITPNLSDACYVQLVQRGGDGALCGKIKNGQLKTACDKMALPKN